MASHKHLVLSLALISSYHSGVLASAKKAQIGQEMSQSTVSEPSSLIFKSWNKIDRKIQKISKKETELLNKKMALELALTANTQAIASLTQTIEDKRFNIIQQSQYLERNKGRDFLKTLMESQNPGQAERHIELLRIITRSSVEQIRRFNNELNQLESERRLYSRRLAQLADLQRDLKQEMNLYFEQLKAKSALVKQLRRQLKNNTEKWQAQLEEALRKKDTARISLFRSLLNKSFYDRKGQLTSPSGGRILIEFGPWKTSQESPNLPFQGLLFDAPAGGPVKAMTDGIVEWIGIVRGLGPTLILDHGLGLRSIYGGVVGEKISVGDKIKEGQLLGTVKKIDFILAQGLYFEVREGTLPSDPRRWILTKSELINNESNRWENVQ